VNARKLLSSSRQFQKGCKNGAIIILIAAFEHHQEDFPLSQIEFPLMLGRNAIINVFISVFL